MPSYSLCQASDCISNMENIQEIKDDIATLRNGLKTYADEIKRLLTHPILLSWHQVDFEKCASDLTTLGVPAKDISRSIAACKHGAANLKKMSLQLTNELGNLHADLEGNFDNAEVRNKAAKNTSQFELIQHEISAIRAHAKSLIVARTQLTANLDLDILLKLAGETVGGRSDLFDNGLKMFKSFFPDNNGNNILQKYIETGKQMEERFKSIEVPKLPNLAEEVILHHITLGAHTSQQVHLFSKTIADRFLSEISTKNLLSLQLKALQDEVDISAILQKSRKIATSLGELVLYMYNKKNILERVPLIQETYQYLNIYYLSIKNSLLDKISLEILADSSINPINAAEKGTKVFFAGVKGLLLSFKLMYSSLKGREAINEIELQLILENAINSCRIFYGDSRQDIHRLKIFIDGLIKKFSRPFPYNQLFRIVKITMADYGSNVESFVHSLEIDEKYHSNQKTKMPKSFGKLVYIIEKRYEIFTKFNRALA